IGMHDDVVWGVESLALEAVDQHGDAAVVLGAGHASSAVLTGDQPALVIASVAVAVVGWAAEDADSPGLLAPTQHAVVRDVAPQQVAAIAEPDRPFGPAEAGGEPLDRGVADGILRKARVDHLNRRVGVADDPSIARPGIAGMLVHDRVAPYYTCRLQFV